VLKGYSFEVYIKLSALTPQHLRLLKAPAPSLASVLREWDRSALSRHAHFVVEPQAALAWASTDSSELASWVRAERNLDLEQRSEGWLLKFSGSATLCHGPAHHRAQAKVGKRYPELAPQVFTFQVRISRVYVIETELPLPAP
jgi:hypothetical protein